MEIEYTNEGLKKTLHTIEAGTVFTFQNSNDLWLKTDECDDDGDIHIVRLCDGYYECYNPDLEVALVNAKLVVGD